QTSPFAERPRPSGARWKGRRCGRGTRGPGACLRSEEHATLTLVSSLDLPRTPGTISPPALQATMLAGKTNMTLLVAVVTFLAAALGVTLFVVFRLASARPSLPVNLEWLEELSMDRYRPMMRLLDGDDLEFLQSTPGFQPEMASRLRKERCRIFRSYLKCLESDFQRVCCALKILMMQADQDRPDLASLLLRSQIAFGWGVLAIQ